jgi:hypothetical protein
VTDDAHARDLDQHAGAQQLDACRKRLNRRARHGIQHGGQVAGGIPAARQRTKGVQGLNGEAQAA